MGISGAWATVSFNSAKRYYIVEASTGRYVSFGVTGSEGFVGLQPAGTIGSKFTLSKVSTGVFKITNADNAEQHFGANHTWNTTNTETQWTITEAGDIAGTYLLQSNKGYLNYQTDHTQSLYVDGKSTSDTDNKKVHFYIMEDFTPSIPSGKFLSIGEKTSTFTAASSGADNDHWYILTQIRDGETPVYNVGTGSRLKRTGTGITTTTLNGSRSEVSTTYLVRFISVGEGLYNLQFADGDFVDGSLNTTALQSQAGKYVFYNCNDGTGSYFGWNKDSNTGERVDNNGAGYTVAFWGNGTVSGTTKNNVWTLYPLEFTDVLRVEYNFSTTDGAFFQSLTVKKTAGTTTYCNLWLSKADVNKPQLKLITSDATSSAGNNMRSSGGLYAKTSPYQYNLSVSEGKIKSYTIVGTAAGALSITPAGGAAESFVANGAVNKKVTLDTPAKSTSFTLTGSGSDQWLDVTKFVIEWETEAEVVTDMSELSNDGIYMITSYDAVRGGLYANSSDYLDACGGHAYTNYPGNPYVAIDAADANQQFAVFTYNNKIYLYNVGREKFVGQKDGKYYKLTKNPTTDWVMSNAPRSNSFYLNSTEESSNHMTISAWTAGAPKNAYTYAVVGSADNEDCNNLILTRIGTLTTAQKSEMTAFFDVNTYWTENNVEVNVKKAGTVGYPKTTTTTYTTLLSLISTFGPTHGYTASDYTKLKAYYEAYVAESDVVLPTAGKFYRFKGAQSGKYLKGENSGNSDRLLNTADEEGAKSIFYLDASSHLLGYSTGQYVQYTSQIAAVGAEEMNTFEFEAPKTAFGALSIKASPSGNNNNERYLYSHTGTENYANRNSGKADETDWYIEEVTALPVSTTSNIRYATFCSPVEVSIPGQDMPIYDLSDPSNPVQTGEYDEVTAFQAKIDGDDVKLVSIDDGVIPANFPVVLKMYFSNAEIEAEEPMSNKTRNLPINYGAATHTAADYHSNALEGTIAAITVGSPIYTLQYNETSETVGFYRKNNGTLKGFKAYLSAPNGARFQGFSFEELTGISAIIPGRITIENAYDLQGRRAGEVKKGVYIVNGKKVLF